MKQHQGAAPRGPARAPARRPARAPRRVRRGRPRRPPASAAPRASLRAAHAQHDVQDTKSQPATGAPQAGATVLLDSVAPAGARCTVCACWASTQQQQLWRLHAASRPRPPHSRVPAWPAGCRGEVPQAARARAPGCCRALGVLACGEDKIRHVTRMVLLFPAMAGAQALLMAELLRGILACLPCGPHNI